jgi:transcriptional regulator with XRE-family HTH domain
MNTELKEQAKQLRLQGMSIKKIAKQLSIAKSTASLWTRGINLTPEQVKGLAKREITDEQAIAHGNIFRNRRLAAQDVGRERVYKEDPLYLAGCMLYWGEGNKSKNAITLANAEPAMLILFRKFLTKFFKIKNEDITITLNCYTDYHSFDEIKNYWLGKLKLPESCLRKSQINNRPKSSKNKMNHSEYGTCYLCVCDTKIVQEIYGAIQEYAGFTNLDWLNGKNK